MSHSEFTNYSNIVAHIQHTARTCLETIEPCTNISINGEIQRLGTHTAHLLRMAILKGADPALMQEIADSLGLELYD